MLISRNAQVNSLSIHTISFNGLKFYRVKRTRSPYLKPTISIFTSIPLRNETIQNFPLTNITRDHGHKTSKYFT